MDLPSKFFYESRRAAIFVLIATNIGSMCLALNLVASLEPHDRISVRRGMALTLLGLLYFTSLFELLNAMALSTMTGARLRQKYRLTCGEVLDISNKVVSAIQAALSCATGVVVCQWSCTRDLVRSSHFMSEAYAWFGAAYFFYDIWSMYVVHLHMTSKLDQFRGSRVPRKLVKEKAKELTADEPSFLSYCRHEPVIILHHLFIGGFGFMVIVYLRGGLGDCVFGWVYLMELSTPFVSFRGVLSRLQLKASRTYLLNGVAMLVSFFLCRVISIPYVCLLYSRVIGLSYIEAILQLPTGCKISIAILMLPQFYWFCLMARGAVKVFLGSSPAPAPKQGPPPALDTPPAEHGHTKAS